MFENLSFFQKIIAKCLMKIIKISLYKVRPRWAVFNQLLQDGYVDIIQPDLSHTGGILEGKKLRNGRSV